MDLFLSMTRSRCIGFLILLVFLTSLTFAQEEPVVAPDPAQAAEQQKTQRQLVAEDKAAIERQRQELQALSVELPKKMEALQVGQLSEGVVDQARIDADAAQLRLESLQANISESERQIKELEQSIRELEAQEQLLQNPAKEVAEGVQRGKQLEETRQTLSQQRTELELEKQNLVNLRNRLELANLRKSLADQWLSRVEEIYRTQQEQSRQQAQKDLAVRLEKEQQAYLNQAAELQRQLDQQGDSLSEAQRRLLQTRIQAVETRAKLVQQQLRLANIDNDLVRLKALADQTDVQPKKLQEGLNQIKALQEELKTTTELFHRGISLGKQQKQVLERQQDLTGADSQAASREAQLIGELLGELNRYRDAIQERLNQVGEIQARLQRQYQESSRRELLERKQLPHSIEGWQQLLGDIAQVPKILLNQVGLSVGSALKTLASANAFRWLGLLVIGVGLLWLIIMARLKLREAIDRRMRREDSSFFGKFILTVFQLLRRNSLGISLTLAIILSVLIFQVPQPGRGIIITLLLLWVGIKVPINLAWLLLADPQIPREQRRPSLYRQLSWALTAGGILTATIILARLSSLPEQLIQFFDRIFMLYLLLFFVTVLRIRRLVIDLLAERYGERAWFISLRLVSLLFTLALLSAVLLGLAGYLSLAWQIAWHLLLFVMVLVGWFMVRGLFNDLVIWLKNYAVTHSGYGLLWTQDVINPLHRILEMALFVGAWLVLFRAYGLEGESAIIANAWLFLESPLFTLGGAQISPWRIIVTVITFLVVIWFGQWSRAVTYRWVFSRIVDLGVRHSLSVFTQYAIVLIGLLITLNIVGLDLTTLTIFAGAVGVGIGFGMQTIANNFISGLLLLIERPLRSGDTVQIGSNTGEITRIGIRSMTMKTWDNLEVIIPNSDVITSAFTNWTHSDNVIRTVLYIGIRYNADPHKAMEIMKQVLGGHKAILSNPEWSVLLWEFRDSVIAFRVQYYTDFFKSNLLDIRSEVMLAIYDGFEKAGIGIPNAQRDLHIKEWPEGVSVVRRVDTLPAATSLEKANLLAGRSPAS